MSEGAKNVPVLEADHLGISFGGLKAVSDFNMTLGKNELVGLIGPNGAGKTTVFNLLTGVYAPTEGLLTINGVPAHGKSTDQIVRMGVARTFQNIRLFKNLTVLDNVLVACSLSMRYSLLEAALRLPRFWKEERNSRQKAMELLKVFHLEDCADWKADNLPYGKQRKLEIARAMATNPSLLLLDEPAAGMNPTETQELMDTIRLLREKFDITIFLVEHDMNLVLGICEKIFVLDYGKLIASGDPQTVINDPKVITAYLGADEEGGETK